VEEEEKGGRSLLSFIVVLYFYMLNRGKEGEMREGGREKPISGFNGMCKQRGIERTIQEEQKWKEKQEKTSSG
jgi:hypothetical protein